METEAKREVAASGPRATSWQKVCGVEKELSLASDEPRTGQVVLSNLDKSVSPFLSCEGITAHSKAIVSIEGKHRRNAQHTLVLTASGNQ